MEGVQIYFSGQSSCPKFVGNSFKKDVCSNCQQKIQTHSGATDMEIKAALEYAVDDGNIFKLSLGPP
jgi:hypothetical protein